MINTEFTYLLIFIFLSRLPFYFSEQELSIREFTIKLFIQVIPLWFMDFNLNVASLLLTFIVIAVAEYVYENKLLDRNLNPNGARAIEPEEVRVKFLIVI